MWSAVNKERIRRLIAAGRMAEIGQAAIDRAKADGSWAQLDEVDALIVPPDLQTALDRVPAALTAYQTLGDSAKKQYLWWIQSAKRPATRTNRIEETIRRLLSEATNGSG